MNLQFFAGSFCLAVVAGITSGAHDLPHSTATADTAAERAQGGVDRATVVDGHRLSRSPPTVSRIADGDGGML